MITLALRLDRIPIGKSPEHERDDHALVGR